MFLKKKNNLIYSLILIILFILSFSAPQAHASSDLGFSFNNGKYNVGDSINIKVVISSDKSINAISGKISFPNHLLTLSSVSKNGSIIDLWAEEPSYSNKTGTVSFGGVMLNGFSGNKGVVINLVFKAKAIGTATINLTEGSVLANDGLGTDIISSKGKSVITINEEQVIINKPINEEKIVETIPVKPTESLPNVEIKQIDLDKTKYYQIPYDTLFLILLLLAILLIFIVIIYYLDRYKKSVKKRMITISSNIEDNFSVVSRDLEKEKEIYSRLKDNAIPLPPYHEEINTLSLLNKEIEEKEKEILKEVRKKEKDL